MIRTSKLVIALAAAAVLATVGVLAFRSKAPSGEVSYREELARGANFADSLDRELTRLPAESVRVSDAAMALYLERHRLGVGSPFRLIEQLMRDPLVESSVRRLLAFALLERTRTGAGYVTDPAALDFVAGESGSVQVPGSSGGQHLAIIRAAVDRQRDPRVGELTVRLAYRLTAASGAIAPRSAELAMSAAAQERDRVLAMRDAQRLLDVAARTRSDPLSLLAPWRNERLFGVEQPVLNAVSARAERSAVEDLPALVARIEALRAAPTGMPNDPLSLGTYTASDSAVSPALPAPADGLARRMATVARVRNAAPEAPITVTVTSYAPLVIRGSANALERWARQRFVDASRNEETIVAEYALLRSRLQRGAPEAAAALLTSSVALRPYAQEHAWLPDDPAPSARELQLHYGVHVSFDREVPEDWRGYLQRSLGLALDDFLLVFPTYDPHGLSVRFGDSPLHERALALHDPVTRTIYFPVASSAGVMAHEFAHDLDWLAARRYYGSAVGYRTDRAVRQMTDQLASALRQMASALRPDTARPRPDPLARPTELFARSVDWFVSAALARGGRVNGYLSAVQDPVLIGYGSATSPELTREGANGTLRALDGMTQVPADVRYWFSTQYGLDRKVTVHEAVRRVLEVPLTALDLRAPSEETFSAGDAVAALLRNDPGTSAAWTCALDAYAQRSTDERSTRAVMQYAAEARARGLLRRWRALYKRYRAPGESPMRTIEGGPWNPALADDMVRDVRDAILWRTVMVGVDRGGEAPFARPDVGTKRGCGAGR